MLLTLFIPQWDKNASAAESTAIWSTLSKTEMFSPIDISPKIMEIYLSIMDFYGSGVFSFWFVHRKGSCVKSMNSYTYYTG